jgi:UDP-glucose 6-dehydrogenase
MVTREQWKIAQEKEIQHHANNFDFNEANKNHYREIYQNIFNFVNPEFNFDVKNKKILEIGPGVFAAFLYCNNTENSIIIEPLNFPENVKKVYENKNIKILNEAVEDIEIPKVDEIWVFNVMQHIYNPGQFVAKLKKSARKILFFEPINTAIDDLHLHSYSFEDFQNYFGKNVVKQYDGGSIKNFHTANCAYGVWESNNIDNIGVIGIGKLGICLSLVLEKAGYNVLGVDINQNYVDLINNKEFKTSEPFVNEYLKTNTNFIATLDLEKAINDSSVVFVVVATPSLKAGQYDHTQVDSLIEKIKKLGKQKESKHLVITCTVMPGYCDKIQNQLEEYNWKVSYNPEFIALGTVIQNQENPDALLIGEADTISGNQLEEIHLRICKNKPMVHRMSRLSAEIAKIALNCALVTKISFANMVGDLAETVGAEKDKILASIGSDSRIGPKFLGYGFGSGGPCCRDFQLVQTSKGLKPISEIVIGEAVLTHKGRYRKVTQTFKTPYTGKMFELLSTGNNNITSSFTPNHPIYCSKNNKTFNFYEVGLFNGSEELALPKYNNDKISEPFNIFYKGKSKSKHMDVKITPEIMKMFGFFLSEGCVLNSNKIRKEDRIVFTFHKKELDYANFIKEIFAKYFNRSVLIKEKKGNNSIVAVSKSVPLAKWFLKNFGKYSHDKKVPYEWLDLPNEYLQELLKGIWYGDGSKTENIYTPTILAENLPETILQTNEDITNEIISCANCQKSYKVALGEYTILKKLNLPIPDACPKCREVRRFEKINKPIFNKTHCRKCKKDIETAHSKEKIVYCVSCYQQEFI